MLRRDHLQPGITLNPISFPSADLTLKVSTHIHFGCMRFLLRFRVDCLNLNISLKIFNKHTGEKRLVINLMNFMNLKHLNVFFKIQSLLCSVTICL